MKIIFSLFLSLSSIALSAQDSVLLVYQPKSYRFFYKVEIDSLDNTTSYTSISDSTTRNKAYLLKDTAFIKTFQKYCKEQQRYRSTWVGPWGFQYERGIYASSLGQRSFRDTTINDYKEQIFEISQTYYLYEGLVPIGITIDSIRKLLHGTDYYAFLEKGGGGTGLNPSIKIRLGVAIDKEARNYSLSDEMIPRVKNLIKDLEPKYKVHSWREGGGSWGSVDSATDFDIEFEAGTNLEGIEIIVNKHQTEIKEIQKAFPYWIIIATKEANSEKAFKAIQKQCPLLKDIIKY